MILDQSMSKDPLNEEDREQSVMKPLMDTPVRYWDILCRKWLNFTAEDQTYWHDIIVLDRTVQFAGSRLAKTRRQIEITLVFDPPKSPGNDTIQFCITLEDFDQYLWEDEEEMAT